MIIKHNNWKYDGTLPFFIGDRRYGQDMVRDFFDESIVASGSGDAPEEPPPGP